MPKIGDTVTCCEDLTYLFKGIKNTVKAGYSLVVKAVIGDSTLVLDRYGKQFIVDKSKVNKK
jgi:hypothetical protein